MKQISVINSIEVPEGYLVVTKWGDEASDSLVVNSRDN